MRLELPVPAMPDTSVPNSSGAMMDLISRRKIVADGRRVAVPRRGSDAERDPGTMAMKIQAVRDSRFTALPTSAFARSTSKNSMCGGRTRCSA